jgi:lysophospholipase L1-like esterase
MFSSIEAKHVVAALTILLLLKAAHAVSWPQGAIAQWGDTLVSTLSNRGLNKEAREALTAGYYEGLLNEGSRLSTMNRFVLDNRRLTWETISRPESRPTNDFLYYEHIPSNSTPDYADQRFRYTLTTNSAGLGDKEYSLVKPERTRRIALLGDSISRGLGAPNGANYESLLEERLNARHTTDRNAHYEILNFSVSGYHITQLLEAAKARASPYQPDVFVLALSDLSVYRRWHGHISSLVYSGIDLKYDYLRNLVQEARLTPNDPLGAFDARLARHRIPTIRWVLNELQSYVAAQGAVLMVILIPSTDEPEALAEAFLGVREVLADEGIPVIDLLDTFADDSKRAASRVSYGDWHPNAMGHQFLFERLYARLAADPVLMESLTGIAASESASAFANE